MPTTAVASAGGGPKPPPPPAQQQQQQQQKQEEEPDVTESERSLLAVYKLLKEQADALRAAKLQSAKAASMGGGKVGDGDDGGGDDDDDDERGQASAALMDPHHQPSSSQSLLGKKRERSESPASVAQPTASSAAAPSPSSSVSTPTNSSSLQKPRIPKRATIINKAPRPSPSPSLGGGAASHHLPPSSRPPPSRPPTLSMPPNKRPGGGDGGGGTRGGGQRHHRDGGDDDEEFSIPKKQLPPPASSSSMQQQPPSSSSHHQQPPPPASAGSSSWENAPPIPRRPNAPAPSATGGGGGGASSSSSSSAAAAAAEPPQQKDQLDRRIYSRDFLLQGVVTASTPNGWDTSEAKQPLVIDLPGFGDPSTDPLTKDTIAIRITVPASSARFTINVCRNLQPADEEGAVTINPNDMVLHFNPRKSYRKGNVLTNTKRGDAWVSSKPTLTPLQSLPGIFGGETFTLRIWLQPDKVTAFVNEHVVAEHDMLPLEYPGEEQRMSLHVPQDSIETLMEYCIVHEVWWGRLSSQPTPAADKPTNTDDAAAAPFGEQQAPKRRLPSAQQQHSGAGLGGGLFGRRGEGEDGGDQGGGGLLGGLLGGIMFGKSQPGAGGGGDALPVVGVSNLPECQGMSQVEDIKQHLTSMFSSFGEGAREVHFKEGSTKAFVVMASSSDQEAAVRALDRMSYQGKMLRCAKSNKAVFT